MGNIILVYHEKSEETSEKCGDLRKNQNSF